MANSTEYAADFHAEVVAENALLLTWPAKIAIAQHQKIIALETEIQQKLAEFNIETLVSYHSLMVYFRFENITTTQLIDKIYRLAQRLNEQPTDHNISDNVCIKVPVYYDLEQQWDLVDVAQRCAMSIDEVIKAHCATTYHGFALGFTPGFCYLASVPPALQLPRKSSPRLKVPQGAVAIAEQQTAIYPIESPGGWHIIGQTPLPMFSSNHGQFIPTIKVGQSVTFYPIGKAEFNALQRELQP